MRSAHTGSTYSRGCHPDEDAVAGELVRLGGGALFGDAARLAFEDCEGRHIVCGSSKIANFGADSVLNLMGGGRNGLIEVDLMSI